MKKIISLTVAIFAFAFIGMAQSEVQGNADAKAVSLERSSVNWTGSKITGEHSGTINLSAGELIFTDGKLVGGQFVIDMTSMVCTDLQGDKAEGLVGHLMSPDFFAVEEFSTASLTITKAFPVGTDGTYKLVGDLTIKGISNPIKFYAKLSEAGATAEITFDRTDYNVRYGSGGFFDGLGDKTIYDEIEMEVNLAY